MINHWWVTRPKRKLNSIPQVLATFSSLALDEEWQGQRDTHLSLEEALEQAGLKRVGERRDQMGGGARTYAAWVVSLGLIFKHESSGKIKLTLAGEDIMNGAPPVEVLKHQVLRYQFPSAFSTSRGVMVAPRFRIRPFRFLLMLLSEQRLGYYLTQEEIGKIVITEAINESSQCFNHIVERIIDFRTYGDSVLGDDFREKYASRTTDSLEKVIDKLDHVANTIVNWIEFTQLAKRNDDRRLMVLDDKKDEVRYIVRDVPSFINRPTEHEYFQRRYGIGPYHDKDTRNLSNTETVTHKVIAEQIIKQSFIDESIKRPIARINSDIIDTIATKTGIETRVVEESLLKFYPRGAVGSFMAEYFEMAFRGRDDAIDFELATVELFKGVFGFESEHVGPIGLTPDVLVLSDPCGYIGIIDNKAYSKYSISNDHKNRMVHNYINTYSSGQKYPLAFFSYIAGGFGANIVSQIEDIHQITGVSGSAISVSNLISLVQNYQVKGYDHEKIKEVFSLNRQVMVKDV